jgi:uncharacterized protein with von Willebrand factor type A (vWA) domain
MTNAHDALQTNPSPPDDRPLLANCVRFGWLLRQLGLPVTPMQIATFVDALALVRLNERADVRAAACALLVTRRQHLPIFHAAFDLFWRMPTSAISPAAPDRPPNTQTGVPVTRTDTSVRPILPGVIEDDEPKTDRTATFSALERLRHKDFARLSAEEMQAVSQQMRNRDWPTPMRRTRRQVVATSGKRIDLRRTLRHSLRHGGEPLRLMTRKQRVRPRPLVVLCDVSGSMERYSRMLVQFAYATLHRQQIAAGQRVEVFLFATRLTRITRQLRAGNVNNALRSSVAVTHDWAGGTRLGEALRAFNYDWSRRVLGQGSQVLIISDGCERGDIDLFKRELDRLRRNCQRLIWLNPLLGAPGYEPRVRGMLVALPLVDEFLPAHNLASLEQLARILAK